MLIVTHTAIHDVGWLVHGVDDAEVADDEVKRGTAQGVIPHIKMPSKFYVITVMTITRICKHIEPNVCTDVPDYFLPMCV